MLVQHTIPDIAEKISRLFSAMKGKDSADVIAKDINDILIYVDKVPPNIVSGAWDLFAQRKGVEI